MSSQEAPKSKADQVQAKTPIEELEDTQLKVVAGGNSNSPSEEVSPPFPGGNHQKPQTAE